MEEIQSRCGILCSGCKYKEMFGCKGCVNIDRPFWGSCELKDCCEDKGYETCGECRKFPCDALKSFAYDPKEGDGGRRIDQCRSWAEEKALRPSEPFEGEEDWSEDFDEDEPEYEALHGHREESCGCCGDHEDGDGCCCGHHHHH